MAVLRSEAIMKSKGYSYSVVGGREMNQDSLLINDSKGLYAVADGVGGGLKGELASEMATTGLDELCRDRFERMTPIFHQLQERVLSRAMAEFGEPVMGTTLTALRVGETSATVCHAGDSRCYHFTQGVLKQLTEDHEFFDERVQGTVLSSYLGLPQDIHPLTVTEAPVPITVGEKLLICSDGLYRQLSETTIIELIRANESDLLAAAKAMCEEAAKKEFSDNVTVVLVEILS